MLSKRSSLHASSRSPSKFFKKKSGFTSFQSRQNQSKRVNKRSLKTVPLAVCRHLRPCPHSLKVRFSRQSRRKTFFETRQKPSTKFHQKSSKLVNKHGRRSKTIIAPRFKSIAVGGGGPIFAPKLAEKSPVFAPTQKVALSLQNLSRASSFK